jgi:hypothetical protein
MPAKDATTRKTQIRSGGSKKAGVEFNSIGCTAASSPIGSQSRTLPSNSPLTAYDELATVRQPKAAFVLNGGVA